MTTPARISQGLSCSSAAKSNDAPQTSRGAAARLRAELHPQCQPRQLGQQYPWLNQHRPGCLSCQQTRSISEPFIGAASDGDAGGIAEAGTDEIATIVTKAKAAANPKTSMRLTM